ncbi:MAG TPA: efflux RND transporter periplasmic adaptor subunit, partial [Phycisphaerae bacterium]|nr:efflux RND transporter periplasmic adaptor subunit [Phycisphaerae bacterium]
MPYDGFVVKKHCEAGEWLQAGQPVVEIVDLEVVRLTLDVPERYLGQIAKGAEAPVVFEGLGGKEFMGKVSQVVPLADDATHTAVVRVDIANTVADGRAMIAAGLLGRVWVPVGEAHEALLVPKDAVIRQGGQDLVYTLSERPPAGASAKPETPPTEEAKKQQEAMQEGGALIAAKSAQYGVKPPPVQFAVAIPVKIIGGYGASMEVQSEHLSAGMPVVVRGTYLMAPGTPVQVRPKESAAEGG